MSIRPIRLAVANDYELVVAGLAAMLEPLREQVEIVELDSGLPVLSDVDVVLYDTFGQAQVDRHDLDSLLDGANGTGTRIVIYSWNTQPEVVDRALRNGVSGYLSKSIGAQELVAALEKVCDGEVVRLDGTVAQEEPVDAGLTWPGKEQGLTPRESEVLALITQGCSNQEIAERTYLSINSVKTYIRTTYRKIGVTRRAQAVGWGMKHGFEPDRVRRVRATD